MKIHDAVGNHADLCAVCATTRVCVCVCENITFGVLQDRKKKNLLFVAQ